MWLRDSGMHRGLFQIFSGPSPHMGSGLAPRLGPRSQSLHHARCFPSQTASIQEVVAMTREDTGGPLLLIYTTMSVCPISLLLHVHSGLGYLAMPLSYLPCWTPGPRVSTQTHANLGSCPQLLFQAEGNKGPVDTTEPQDMDRWL